MYKNRTGKGKPRVELLRERIKALTTRIKPGSPSPIPVPGSLHIVTTRTEPVPLILQPVYPRLNYCPNQAETTNYQDQITRAKTSTKSTQNQN